MATKLTDTQAQKIVDENDPRKREENGVFSYWHCEGRLDGYWYRSQRTSSETLSKESTLSQAKTYFKNYFKTLDYLGVKPTPSDEIPN